MIYRLTFLLVALILLISATSCKSVATQHNTTSEIDSVAQRKQDSLAFELCQIYGLDQGIRDSRITFNKAKIMSSIDTLSFVRVVNFVVMNGFPTEELVGKRNYSQECVSMAFPAVLLHNSHRLINEQKYFDLFFNEVRKGNLQAEYFAMILDKYYWGNSKNKDTRRVFYGSQFGKPCIQTKEATNKARIEIGLEALEDSGFVDCGDEVLDMPKERR
ncbi:hypothetical protein [Flavobacterium tegetincola]|uniref:hypothetical protein n=1 Tax=Flavobacterium tegetincola TaxID=150172 RepID=UPI0003F4BA95|nr:hypothetical protein [Flavobacterium tegetincola]